MNKRKLVILLSVAVVLLAAWAIKSVVFPSFHPGSLVRYQGTTELGPIDLQWDEDRGYGTLSLSDGTRSWHVNQDDSKKENTWQVSPFRTTAENTQGLLTWLDGIDKVPADGLWTIAPGTDPEKIQLSTVTRYEEMSVSSGFLFGKRGLKKTLRIRLEPMSDLDPWQESVISKILILIPGSARSTFFKGAYKEAWQFFRHPTAANMWWQHWTFTKSFQNKNLLSLQGMYHEYTGGAHGNLVYKPVNAYRAGNNQHVFRLEDLFDPASPAEQALSDLCIESLSSQGASQVVKGSLTFLNFGQMYAFTFDETKLSIHFAPYAVASYAEGSFTVSIPADKIIDLLSGQGPGKFLKEVWE
jgi:hypothetical protein